MLDINHLLQLSNTYDKVTSRLGYSIIETPWLTKTVAKTVKRTWRARLRSKFWQPTEVLFEVVPDLNYYRVGNMILCHPSTRLALEKAIKDSGDLGVLVKSL